MEAIAGQLRAIAAAIHSGRHEYDPPVSELLETLGQMADADRRMRCLIADLAGRRQPGIPTPARIIDAFDAGNVIPLRRCR